MPHNTERALIVSALWLHIGFIGAAALVAGLLQLFDGGPTWPWSLGLMLSGGMLTAAGWRRGRIILEDAGRTGAVPTDASSEPTSRPVQATRTRRNPHVVLHPAAIEPEARR